MEKLTDSFTEEANVGTTERIISSGAGTALIAKGIAGIIKKPTIASYIELASGTYLMWRGVTAFCAIKNILKEKPSKK